VHRRIAIALAGALTMLAGSVGNEAKAIDADRVPPAPVGHRQPTARDVPATAATPQNSAEDAMKKMDQDLDRKMKNICRGC
jgi:hypothetical protein